MTDQEKTAEEIAEDLLGNEEEVGGVVYYKIDVKKLEKYSYQAIADALNDIFTTVSDELNAAS